VYPDSKVNVDRSIYATVLTDPKADIYVNGVILQSNIFKIESDKKYNIKAIKDGYQSMEFDILGPSIEKLDKFKNYNIVIEVKLFEVPINTLKEGI